MSRLVVLLMAMMFVSSVLGLAKHCQGDSECKNQGKADVCSKGLCRQSCFINSECASGDCEHDFPNPKGYCKVEKGNECTIIKWCPSGKECDSGYCVPDY